MGLTQSQAERNYESAVRLALDARLGWMNTVAKDRGKTYCIVDRPAREVRREVTRRLQKHGYYVYVVDEPLPQDAPPSTEARGKVWMISTTAKFGLLLQDHEFMA